MKSRFLFPHKWRLVGYCCFAATMVFAIALKLQHPEGYVYADLHQVPGSGHHLQPDTIIDQGTRWHNDIIISLIIFGLVLIAFSKEKIEDEQISQLRLDSLQWATYLNYAIFFICVLFIYGVHFIPVLIFNTISPLIFFIIRFRWKIHLLNSPLRNEEKNS
ncbi:MAG TPA: hypothetical protein VNX40_16150 [Mucilaginibacter sp.]|jgi:hypothetical protein|nr:hypothetical protein [Mucilaginibacter sp.]